MNNMNELNKYVIVIHPQRVIKDYAVGVYARVSTNRKEQLDSLAVQVSVLTRLAAAHMTWFVADIFLDVASAKVGSSRSEFNRMIDECEKGNLDIILTKSVSRFDRDTKEGLEAIRNIRSCGTRIIFETDKIDTETVDDELLLSVVQACSQAENDWRSENIVWGLRHRAEDVTTGLYSRVCYGYKKDKHGMLIIEEDQVQVVRDIFDWYLKGLSIGSIIKRLKSRGVKFPKGKDIWSKQAVESTLTMRKYTCDVAIAVSGNASCQNLNTDHHAGIISKETFEAVEIEMAARSNVELEKTEKFEERIKSIVLKRVERIN